MTEPKFKIGEVVFLKGEIEVIEMSIPTRKRIKEKYSGKTFEVLEVCSSYGIFLYVRWFFF